jgi:tetratricopeptide (TPR) repeat protein
LIELQGAPFFVFFRFRFRFPVLPVLIVFAAHALLWLAEQAKRRRPKRFGEALLLVRRFGFWSTQQALARADSSGYLQLALAESRRGRVEDAVPYLRRALEMSPNDATILTKLGLAEQILGNHDAAVRHYRRALEVRPMRTNALDALLELLIDRGRAAEAESIARNHLQHLARHGIEEQPEIAHYHLGRALAECGDLEGAGRAYTEALRIDRRSARAARALGDLARDSGR